jgi:hypothetical protein
MGIFSPSWVLARGDDRWDRNADWDAELVMTWRPCAIGAAADGDHREDGMARAGVLAVSRKQDLELLMHLVGAVKMEVAPPAEVRRSVAGGGNLRRRRSANGEEAIQEAQGRNRMSRRCVTSPGRCQCGRGRRRLTTAAGIDGVPRRPERGIGETDTD